uniref:Immunoglobulin V-set domain-containing protein n=1 Tax=Eptatretus burgeri TaxID=7764 RepID=A0A8C4R7H9_EPTBU
MKIELCAQRELIGLWGEDVILPCLFNHSERNTIKDVHLLLYKTKRSTENILYNSSSNYTHESFKGRVQSVGNPSEGDGSVRIRDLKMEDEGTFICRFD